MADCTLAVRVLPNAPRNVVVGWIEADVLKVKVHAPALEGRANEELCEFIAEVLQAPKRDVTVARGEKSRRKILQLRGLALADARARIDRHLAPAN